MCHIKPLIFLFFISLFFSCGSKEKYQHSFYYWKTTFDKNDTLSPALMRQLGINHFYIRYMDVDWNPITNAPVPTAQLNTKGGFPFVSQQFTPVIFITNSTFRHIAANKIDTLALNITQKIIHITKQIIQNDTLPNLLEIQIDCDWTAETKDAYFTFLRKLKALNKNTIISATIRLYPYKYYPKIGVPPIDRGILMCYNTGSITDIKTENSIFSLQEINKYLSNIQYPLPLDVALPIFSWQAWFRGGKFKQIIHNLPLSCRHIILKQQNNIYRFVRDTVIDELYFREGDELRYEAADETELVAVANLLTHQLPACNRISFFAWDTLSISKYEEPILKIFKNH